MKTSLVFLLACHMFDGWCPIQGVFLARSHCGKIVSCSTTILTWTTKQIEDE